jgi:hypothetical protein
VRQGEPIRVDLKIAAKSLDASLMPRRGMKQKHLIARALDTPKRHWRVALPARIPRGWVLSLAATYADGDGTFGATLARNGH